MKTTILTAMVIMMSALSAQAKTPWVCTVSMESNPGEYNKQLVSVAVTDFDKNQSIYVEDGITYAADVKNDGTISLAAYKVSEQKILGSAFGKNTDYLGTLLPEQKRILMCYQVK